MSIKNYRTLEDLLVNFSGFYTAISGKNNAGKTSLLRCLTVALGCERRSFPPQLTDINYQDDKTKWTPAGEPIILSYEFSISREFDPGLFRFIEKQASITVPADEASLLIELKYDKSDAETVTVTIGGEKLDSVISTEVLEKVRTSKAALLHNSFASLGFDEIFISGGRFRALHEPTFGPAEREEIANAQRTVRSKLKRLVKSHKEALSDMLGKLEDRIEPEFTIPEFAFARGTSLAINLKDRSVEVPFAEWGSGTQNRTKILMSILGASKIRKDVQDISRVTPMVIIEEPESFLHPEAQAVFGRALRETARELKVQIVATTHSPYMLCQDEPETNILLSRVEGRNKKPKTVNIECHKDNWMEPFAQVLGLSNKEFDPWRSVIGSKNSIVVFVEGETDKSYIEHLGKVDARLALPSDWEVVPYNGKDTLKNWPLLKIFMSKYQRVFVTYDKDVAGEVEPSLLRAGLEKGKSFCAVGSDEPGHGRIEGLVPKRILSSVGNASPELFLALETGDSSARKAARSEWKRKVLAAFCSEFTYAKEELAGFAALIAKIRTGLK